MNVLFLRVGNSKIRDNEECVHNFAGESRFKTSTWWPKTRWKFRIYQVPQENELWKWELGGNSLAFLWRRVSYRCVNLCPLIEMRYVFWNNDHFAEYYTPTNALIIY